MQVINLYRYSRPDGGITVSPVKPDCEFEQLVRIVADEGKLVSNGVIVAACTDTATAEGWTEIDDPNYIPPEEMEII